MAAIMGHNVIANDRPRCTMALRPCTNDFASNSQSPIPIAVQWSRWAGGLCDRPECSSNTSNEDSFKSGGASQNDVVKTQTKP
ncbi:hypothetical protein EVAR_63922_1 [Eumeta japonica]|uniref:Uncharacterized protein n=1 Tax=Eumeta variegata TaxID=151549 RepID=A0A4C1ZM06_EUMVA|nr:hypothetical protein EVAR_63922_1 [Eumeta japonica]